MTHIERIIATKPGLDPISFEILRRKPLKTGIEEKERLTCKLVIPESLGEVRFLVKKRVDLDDLMGNVELLKPSAWYYQNWLYLKEVGMPTVPELYLLSDEEVLMPDLSADGSKIYGSHMVFERTRKPDLIDRIFLDIPEEETECEAKKLAIQATNNGVWLPYNDPLELIVHPDRARELLVLDLSAMSYKRNPRWPHLFEEHNSSIVKCFLQYLDTIREKLKDSQRYPYRSLFGWTR